MNSVQVMYLTIFHWFYVLWLIFNKLQERFTTRRNSWWDFMHGCCSTANISLCIFSLIHWEKPLKIIPRSFFAGDTALVPRRRIFSEISQQWKLFLCLSWYFKLNKSVNLFVPTFELLKYSHESKLLLNGLDGWFNTSSKVFLGIGNYGIEMVSWPYWTGGWYPHDVSPSVI